MWKKIRDNGVACFRKISPTRKENQMSVSLREVEDKIDDILIMAQISVKSVRQAIIDKVMLLFPSQLTEEEVEKILPKKCLEGNEFDDLTLDLEKQKIYSEGFNKCRELCKSALIGKCATPTFSGGEKKSTCEYGLDNCSTCKPIPAEKKCSCTAFHEDPNCKICGKKAEKKEEKCPHGLERHYGCDRRT
jgi:hypothetical protein